jgi:hypothetical protein
VVHWCGCVLPLLSRDIQGNSQLRAHQPDTDSRPLPSLPPLYVRTGCLEACGAPSDPQMQGRIYTRTVRHPFPVPHYLLLRPHGHKRTSLPAPRLPRAARARANHVDCCPNPQQLAPFERRPSGPQERPSGARLLKGDRIGQLGSRKVLPIGPCHAVPKPSPVIHSLPSPKSPTSSFLVITFQRLVRPFRRHSCTFRSASHQNLSDDVFPYGPIRLFIA